MAWYNINKFASWVNMLKMGNISDAKDYLNERRDPTHPQYINLPDNLQQLKNCSPVFHVLRERPVNWREGLAYLHSLGILCREDIQITLSWDNADALDEVLTLLGNPEITYYNTCQMSPFIIGHLIDKYQHDSHALMKMVMNTQDVPCIEALKIRGIPLTSGKELGTTYVKPYFTRWLITQHPQYNILVDYPSLLYVVLVDSDLEIIPSLLKIGYTITYELLVEVVCSLQYSWDIYQCGGSVGGKRSEKGLQWLLNYREWTDEELTNAAIAAISDTTMDLVNVVLEHHIEGDKAKISIPIATLLELMEYRKVSLDKLIGIGFEVTGITVSHILQILEHVDDYYLRDVVNWLKTVVEQDVTHSSK